MPELYSVAIDGPSGAGKSTLAKAAAAALGICYVDTGAIYRTIGYGVYCRGIDPSDAAAVAFRRCGTSCWSCSGTRPAAAA